MHNQGFDSAQVSYSLAVHTVTAVQDSEDISLLVFMCWKYNLNSSKFSTWLKVIRGGYSSVRELLGCLLCFYFHENEVAGSI